jgi:hypothetical protein
VGVLTVAGMLLMAVEGLRLWRRLLLLLPWLSRAPLGPAGRLDAAAAVAAAAAAAC